MRIFERLRARFGVSPDQVNEALNDMDEGAIRQSVFEPTEEGTCCGHCSGQQAARSPDIAASRH